MTAALRLDAVTVRYQRRRDAPVRALDDVTLSVERGESVALVGRSGAGKSTIARLALGLEPPTSGTVHTLGREVNSLNRRGLRRLRREAQLVFQDPFQSLHPGLRVGQIVAEPLAIAGVPAAERRARVIEALGVLGLTPPDHYLERFPTSLSGGQRQRVALARTLVARPQLILADEPTSMLDASLRAMVADRLLGVRDAVGATLVFITHDLALARHVADRTVVLHGGRVVEDADTERLIRAPGAPATVELLDAAMAVGASVGASRPTTIEAPTTIGEATER